jgi:hypothetical protein
MVDRKWVYNVIAGLNNAEVAILYFISVDIPLVGVVHGS